MIPVEEDQKIFLVIFFNNTFTFLRFLTNFQFNKVSFLYGHILPCQGLLQGLESVDLTIVRKFFHRRNISPMILLV